MAQFDSVLKRSEEIFINYPFYWKTSLKTSCILNSANKMTRFIDKIDKRLSAVHCTKISEYIYFFVINPSIDYSSINVELAFVIGGYIQKGE
jgi:hypothetical protein